MICADFRDHVDELLDGLLPPEEAHRYEVHSAECEACAAEMETAAKFFNFLHDDGREALEEFDVRHVTQDVARRVAREAAQPENAMPRGVLHRWRWPLRAAAAVAFVAAGLSLPSWRVTESEVLLAEGTPLQLVSGQRSAIRAGSSIQVEAAASFTIEPATDRESVRLDRGAALFTLAPDVPLAVATERGTVLAAGTTFFVEVQDDGDVALSVLAGRAEFQGAEGKRAVRVGERLLVEEGDVQTLVSVRAIHELELTNDLLDNEAHVFRGKVERAEEELAEYRGRGSLVQAAPPAPVITAEMLDELRWDWTALAAAARVLVPRSRGRYYESPERMRAVAVFLMNVEDIRAITGERNPMDGLWHPAFIARMAEPFFDVLAPTAQPKDRQACTARVRGAAEIAHAELSSDPVPAKIVAIRLRLFRDMLSATREHLGDRVAADLAEGMHIVDRLSRVLTVEYGDNSIRDVNSTWGKHFDLVADQRDALEAHSTRYVNATLLAQSDVQAQLGEQETKRILFPESYRLAYGRRWAPGKRGKRGKRDDEKAPYEDDRLQPDERVDAAVRAIDAKLAVCGPRIEFQEALRALLRPDQLSRGWGWHWGLLTFRREEG